MIDRVKVWYVLTGTGGEVGSSYLVRTEMRNNVMCAILSDTPTASENGWNTLQDCFLTKKQATDDWRRRSKAETREHITAIYKTAAELNRIAACQEKQLRLKGDGL